MKTIICVKSFLYFGIYITNVPLEMLVCVPLEMLVYVPLGMLICGPLGLDLLVRIIVHFVISVLFVNIRVALPYFLS